MELQEDIIAEISKTREKFFGCSGRMLLPSRATVEAFLQKIPENQLVTTDLLRQRLAEQFNVEVTCPATTQKVLRAIAKDPRQSTAYWRVIKKNGALISIFPGGVEGHAALLQRERFPIDTQGKAPRVRNFEERLVRF